MVVCRRQLNGDIAVAAHGRTGELQRAGRHLAVGNAGLPAGSAGNGVGNGDRDDKQTAQDGDQIILADLFPQCRKLPVKFHVSLRRTLKEGTSSFSSGHVRADHGIVHC